VLQSSDLMTGTSRLPLTLLGTVTGSLLLGGVLGCAQSPRTTPPPPVRVTYSDIEPSPDPPASPAQAEQQAVVPAATDPDAPLSALGAPLSTREAMEKALNWAVEGLRFYERGDYDSAHSNLNDARIILLEADLPKFWEDQGLAILQPGLPEDLRRHDLAVVVRDLERTARSHPENRAERVFIESEVRRILRQFGDTSPADRDFEMLVAETESYIDFYRGKYRGFFERSYLRKHKYWPTIRTTLAAQNLPPELGYIAFIESGFSPRARSHANAHGLWQFIPETGRRYGLVQRDDFADVRMSTAAAADYLLDLLAIFGSRSFLLAAAAYNAGEGKIISCLRQIDNPFEKRSFWEIRGCLAQETRDYIPKLIAAIVLSSDPKRFGFDLPSEEEFRQRFDVVVLPQVVQVATLAQMAGVGVDDLRSANSDLEAYAGTTPGRNFPLYLPYGQGQALEVALSASPPPVVYASSEPLTSRKQPERTYVVRRGDTLSAIARKRGLDVDDLVKRNRLRSPSALKVGQRLVLPGGGSSADEPSRIVFTVQQGNSLEAIADLFAVRYRDIMEWNKLKSRSLKAGQKLSIHPSRSFESRSYEVQRGDSLGEIARRFGVSVEDLVTANGPDVRDILRPGQRLQVYAPAGGGQRSETLAR
jgi:membrane-bound lytic murein transglycosylase D